MVPKEKKRNKTKQNALGQHKYFELGAEFNIESPKSGVSKQSQMTSDMQVSSGLMETDLAVQEEWRLVFSVWVAIWKGEGNVQVVGWGLSVLPSQFEYSGMEALLRSFDETQVTHPPALEVPFSG